MSWNAIKALYSAAESTDPRVQRNWRVFISSLLLAIVLVIAWVLGAFTYIHLDRVAWAGEVDQKIEAALKPVNDKLDVQDGYLKRLVKKDIRDELYDKFRELCRATEARKKQALRDDIEDLQTEYERIEGKRYPQPDCEEL